jgi:hypothetical protein
MNRKRPGNVPEKDDFGKNALPGPYASLLPPVFPLSSEIVATVSPETAVA